MGDAEKLYNVAAYPDSDTDLLGVTIKGKAKNFLNAHKNLLDKLIKERHLK